MSSVLKMGRGGAGNIITENDQVRKEEERGHDAETEAQLREAERNAKPKQEEEYKHMGRGGAGNWYTPADLAAKGALTPNTENGKSGSSTPEPLNQHPHSLRTFRGRGGAGNYTHDQAENSDEIEKQEEERARQVEEEVRREVEKGLKKPTKAHLSSA